MPSEAEKKLVDFLPGKDAGWKRILLPGYLAAEQILGINGVNEVYRGVVEDKSTLNFFTRTLRSMRVSYEVSEADLERIPREGPVLAVANHPYGGLDGIVFGGVLTSVRDDAKLLANYLLARMPEIQPWLIAADPFGGPDSKRKNFAAMKETIRHLKDGGCVGTFPSGTVSFFSPGSGEITDPTWSDNTAGLIKRSEATVVPVYFRGHNGRLFQWAGRLHPRFRTLLLPREMMRMRGSTVALRIGKPIPFRKLKDFESDQAMTDFLRLNTYVLAQRSTEDEKPRRFTFSPRPRPTTEAPIGAPVPSEKIAADFAQLPEGRHLVEHGDLQVYAARAQEIPNILDEIGRLREITFREVGEGTGDPLDLDRYDLDYWHLFIWDNKAKCIAGAYRLGPADEIIFKRGQEGLYTTTLFTFKPGFLDSLNPALEVGRSFIISEYQKKHATLSLLWRGIGRFVVQHPQYRVLFGPVSISQEYHAISKDLMVKFMRKNRSAGELARLVKAKNPPRDLRDSLQSDRETIEGSLRDIDDVSALISEIETDQKGVPVLLKHYLKLNGVMLSFNVDPDFGNCMDGLILVDLVKSDQKLLKAYMGTEGLAEFLAYHDKTDEASSGTTSGVVLRGNK